MKNKKSKFTLEEAPEIVTAKQMAKDRGLDLAILEKEAELFSFGAVQSGVVYINAAKYDAWIAAQIRETGIEKEQKKVQKTISETTNPGILKGLLSKIPKQLKTDSDELQYLQSEIPNLAEGLEQKEGLIEIARLSAKIAGKKKTLKIAEKRLNHLRDAELGFLKPTDEVDENENDSDAESDEVRFTATIGETTND